MTKNRLFDNAEFIGDAEKLRFTAKKLKAIERNAKAQESTKTPPPEFEFDDSVLEDAERMLNDEDDEQDRK